MGCFNVYYLVHETEKADIEQYSPVRNSVPVFFQCDHSLLLHPDQQACIAQRQPLYTIGSLQRRLQMESFTTWLTDWIDDSTFKDKLEQLTETIRPLFPLLPSLKHVNGQYMGRLDPTPGLKYRGLEEVKATS